LPQHAAARRTERLANRELLLPDRGAREHEVRDVCAGDQQHEPDGTEQTEHRGTDVT
jgi:hypothetical protein